MSNHRITLRGLLISLAVTIVFILIVTASLVAASDKVTICHAAGQEGTTKFVTLTIDHHAVYGSAGHFYENGTPRAGHEEDYLGACTVEETETPTVGQTPTLEGSQSPSPMIPDTAMHR